MSETPKIGFLASRPILALAAILFDRVVLEMIFKDLYSLALVAYVRRCKTFCLISVNDIMGNSCAFFDKK